MKKIFAIVMAICLMVTVLCATSCAVGNISDDASDNTSDNVNSDVPEETVDENEEKLPDHWETMGMWEFYSASIFGEGSPAMVVALLALVASIASICLTVALYKKATAPEGTSKTEDEE